MGLSRFTVKAVSFPLVGKLAARRFDTRWLAF
jgi:hypothetical protein